MVAGTDRERLRIRLSGRGTQTACFAVFDACCHVTGGV